MTNLLGQGSLDDHYTSGFGRVSREIGDAINGVTSVESLFKNDVLPDANHLRAIAQSEAIGEVGTLLLNLLADVIEPPTDTEGYVKIDRRASQVARRAKRGGGIGDVKLCADTEEHFANYISDQKNFTSIIQDGKVIALQKGTGDHTTVLIKPAVLDNGVRVPVGTVLINEGNEESGYKFGFGRLTAFNAEDPHTAIQDFPDIIGKHFAERRGQAKLFSGMNAFNEIVGRPGQHVSAEQLVRDTLDAQPDLEGDQAVAAVELVKEIDAKLHDDAHMAIAARLDQIHHASLDAALQEPPVNKTQLPGDRPEFSVDELRQLLQPITEARRALRNEFPPDLLSETESLTALRRDLIEYGASLLAA